MDKLTAVVALLVITTTTITTAMAYPFLISERGTNHTQNKELVYSIPEKYFNFVDTIEFKPDYAYCRAYGDFEQKKCYSGRSYVKWDVYHNCYNGIIILSNPKYLIHELGHIYEHCELKRNISTEEFANNFKVTSSLP